MGGIIALLGIGNVLFEKPNMQKQDLSYTPDNGIHLHLNRFPAFIVMLMPGSVFVILIITTYSEEPILWGMPLIGILLVAYTALAG